MPYQKPSSAIIRTAGRSEPGTSSRRVAPASVSPYTPGRTVATMPMEASSRSTLPSAGASASQRRASSSTSRGPSRRWSAQPSSAIVARAAKRETPPIASQTGACGLLMEILSVRRAAP